MVNAQTGYRAEVILAQGASRRFVPFDRFAQLRERPNEPLGGLLDDFAQLRASNLQRLSAWELTDRHLALEGQHPELGTVTLRELLSAWVAHDLGHIAQISRVMAKQYRMAVGPWRAYLPVMER